MVLFNVALTALNSALATSGTVSSSESLVMVKTTSAFGLFVELKETSAMPAVMTSEKL